MPFVSALRRDDIVGCRYCSWAGRERLPTWHRWRNKLERHQQQRELYLVEQFSGTTEGRESYG